MSDPRTAYQRGRILAAIANEPLTAQQLADRLHLTRDGINIHLKAMKEATPRLVHIAGHVYNPDGGRPAPKYSPGDKQDAVYVSSRVPTRHLQTDQNKAKIMRLLESKKMTILQLAEQIDLSHQWTRHLIAGLRKDKRVHIGGWQRQTAGIAPLYAIGNKADVKKPVMSSAEAYKRFKARLKSDPDAKENHYVTQKRRRMKTHIKRLMAKPQPWFAALMV
jgi:predicted ArsR family transcriptional regulator